jgi:hypothetical protein
MIDAAVRWRGAPDAALRRAMMRSRPWLILLASFGLAAPGLSDDLWLSCPTGLEISVDGTYVGVCRADQELTHIDGLSDGVHEVQIGGDQGPVRQFGVAIGTVPHQVVVADLEPAAAVAEAGDAPPPGRGNIQITSDPLECTVRVGDLWADKQQPVLTLQGVSAGPHRLWFEHYGQILKVDTVVETGETLRFKVDFGNKLVTNLDQTKEEIDGAVPVTEPGKDGDCQIYWVEVLRTSDLARVEEVQKMLDELGFPPQHQKLITVDDEGVLPLYKLRVGPIDSMHLAKYTVHTIKPAQLLGLRILAEPCPAAP